MNGIDPAILQRIMQALQQQGGGMGNSAAQAPMPPPPTGMPGPGPQDIAGMPPGGPMGGGMPPGGGMPMFSPQANPAMDPRQFTMPGAAPGMPPRFPY